MKKFPFVLFLTILIFACGKKESTNTATPPIVVEQPTTTLPTPVIELPEVANEGYNFTDTDTAGWELIWEDNFDSNLLAWQIWTGGAFNNELQMYQGDNLFVENDFLYIRQRRQAVTGRSKPFDETSKNFKFTSGRIETKTLYSPSQVGGLIRFAARIKLPEGEGLWPAFWSYGDPWPTQGEIDIIENRGGETNKYSTNFFYGKAPSQVLTNSNIQTFHYQHPEKLSEAFHVYELEWSQTDLVMKLDGQVIKTYNVDEFGYVDDLFDTSQKIVLNLAVGGDFFASLEESKIPDESYLVVDWVKVFKQ